MPRALEPNSRFPVVLESDEQKPAAKRPTFWCVSKSVRDWIAKRDELLEAGTTDAWAMTIELLKPVVVGWDHMIDPETNEPIPFDLDQLKRMLDFAEATELLDKVRFNVEAKKN